MQAMKKRAVVIFVVFCCVFSMAAGASQGISVVVNGTPLATTEPAVMVNGTVMLPFRSIFNALGVSNSQIQWNAAQKSIEVRTSDERYIFLVVGSKGALVNDKMLTLPVAPFIQNGSTFVPVRFVSEALNAVVKWDASSKTVWITK